jgi:hypothetical protein
MISFVKVRPALVRLLTTPNIDTVEMSLTNGLFLDRGGKYSNKAKKIVSVEVTDNDNNQTQSVKIPTHGKCTALSVGRLEILLDPASRSLTLNNATEIYTRLSRKSFQRNSSGSY